LLNAAAIAVAVKDGIVTLTGHVTAYTQKLAAARAAERVAGVRAVVNELEVGLRSRDERSDEEIARAEAMALVSHASVPLDRVKAHVSHGWVTLEGALEWQDQKEAAERAACSAPGATAVESYITVEP
jgi:osmotically-inducible protein OsmY